MFPEQIRLLLLNFCSRHTQSLEIFKWPFCNKRLLSTVLRGDMIEILQHLLAVCINEAMEGSPIYGLSAGQPKALVTSQGYYAVIAANLSVS